jgi:hypothetical protein
MNVWMPDDSAAEFARAAGPPGGAEVACRLGGALELLVVPTGSRAIRALDGRGRTACSNADHRFIEAQSETNVTSWIDRGSCGPAKDQVHTTWRTGDPRHC